MKEAGNRFKACGYPQRCISKIRPINWWVYIELYFKAPEKGGEKSWSVYIQHPNALYTIYMSKYVETVETIGILWQKHFDFNSHQKFGNKLGNNLSCGIICIIIWILVMLIKHIVIHIQLVGPVFMRMFEHVNDAYYWQPSRIFPPHNLSLPL